MSPRPRRRSASGCPTCCAKLKAPRVLERLEQTAARAREEGWPYEQFLETLLEAEVFARDASGARQRIRHAAFPAHKTLGGLRLHRAARRREAADPAPRPARLDRRARQRLLLRPARHRQDPPRDRARRSRPARPATASPSPPPSNGSTASRQPSTATRSTTNCAAWSATTLLVVDEIGYLPLERQAANLLFALVARRYERGSIIVTSNRGFEAWGEILGDAMVAAALIDRLVHHAHMVTLKGKSYRLRERGPGAAPAAQAPSLRALRLNRDTSAQNGALFDS